MSSWVKRAFVAVMERVALLRLRHRVSAAGKITSAWAPGISLSGQAIASCFLVMNKGRALEQRARVWRLQGANTGNLAGASEAVSRAARKETLCWHKSRKQNVNVQRDVVQRARRGSARASVACRLKVVMDFPWSGWRLAGQATLPATTKIGPSCSGLRLLARSASQPRSSKMSSVLGKESLAWPVEYTSCGRYLCCFLAADSRH